MAGTGANLQETKTLNEPYKRLGLSQRPTHHQTPIFLQRKAPASPAFEDNYHCIDANLRPNNGYSPLSPDWEDMTKPVKLQIMYADLDMIDLNLSWEEIKKRPEMHLEHAVHCTAREVIQTVAYLRTKLAIVFVICHEVKT